MLHTGISQYLYDGYSTSLLDLLSPQSRQCLSLPRKTVLERINDTGRKLHGCVTAITVAPEYRHLGLVCKMMNLLEFVSVKLTKDNVRFVNEIAIEMYEGIRYSVVWEREG